MSRSEHGRIPSLDGLRAVAILLVLFGHAGGTRGFPASEETTYAFNVAGFGVRLFFVISGFLITTLILKEHRATGRLSLRRFYFRRTLRIFPPFYFYLACAALLAAAGVLELDGRDLLHAATYTTNMVAGIHWGVAHSWSLAVEEQFYLLWPVVIVLAGVRRSLRMAVAYVAVAPFLRVFLLAIPSTWVPMLSNGVGSTLPTVGDALAVGCVLAGFRDRLWAMPRYRRLLESRGFWLVPISALLLSFCDGHWANGHAIAPLSALQALTGIDQVHALAAFHNLLGITLMNVGIMVSVDRLTRMPEGRAGALLNARAMTAVGVVSYSLYLWQEPFLNRQSPGWWAAFPLNLALAALCAFASYRLVEKPALNARAALERRLEGWWQARRARAEASVA
jgi:peptidoglycan/LPS O-acetylase OafA/YrhL